MFQIEKVGNEYKLFVSGECMGSANDYAEIDALRKAWMEGIDTKDSVLF